MKLYFIIDNNEPHASGGGYYALFKFAEFLAERNHDVYISAVNDFGWIGPGSKANVNYRFKIQRKSRVFRKIDKFVSSMYDISFVEPAIREIKPDWIIGVLTDSAIKAVNLGKKFNIPVANFIYECPPWVEEMVGADVFRKSYVGYIKKLWDRTKEAYLDSDILFPNSELSRYYNSSWLGRDVSEPVYPGIDAALMPYFESEETEPLTTQNILYVGRLVDTKNVDKLIAAFLKIDGGATLHICGDGPDRQRLMDMAGTSDRIIFHGFVADEDLWSLYRSSDLVVFPSSFEGFGMPPMQALYFGKPCVVSDIPIFRSIYGDYLEYFQLNNIQQLHHVMDRLLSDSEYRYIRGREGREFVLKNFQWSISAKKIEDHLLSHQRRRS